MDMLKKFFPLSWKFQGDVKNLVIGILIYVFGSMVVSFILGLTIIGVLLAPFVGIYSMAGVIISILLYANVLKDEPAKDNTAENAPADEAKDDSAEK